MVTKKLLKYVGIGALALSSLVSVPLNYVQYRNTKRLEAEVESQREELSQLTPFKDKYNSLTRILADYVNKPLKRDYPIQDFYDSLARINPNFKIPTDKSQTREFEDFYNREPIEGRAFMNRAYERFIPYVYESDPNFRESIETLLTELNKKPELKEKCRKICFWMNLDDISKLNIGDKIFLAYVIFTKSFSIGNPLSF